jgi:hypothetical protein
MGLRENDNVSRLGSLHIGERPPWHYTTDMSKAFSTEVRKSFAESMRIKFPQFHPIKVPPVNSWPGERSYLWDRASSLCCSISLIVGAKGNDDFFVEVGWSRLRRFPRLSSRPSIAAMEPVGDYVEEEEFICNLSSIARCPTTWQAPNRKAEEGLSEMEQYLASLQPTSIEEASSAANSLVGEAINAIETYAIPFFDSLVRQ